MRATLTMIILTIALSIGFSFGASLLLQNTTSYTTTNITTMNTDQYVKHAIVGNHYVTTHYNVRNHKETRNPNSAVNTLDRVFGVNQVR
jgi:hypothetical protein